MAKTYPDFRRAGVEVIAISVDPVSSNAGLTAKLELPYPFLSDPGGEQAIKPLEVWEPEEEIARAAQILLGPDGNPAFRYVGVDTLDRPGTDELLARAEELDAPERESVTEVFRHLEAEPSERAFQLDLCTYMRGVRSAAMTLNDRNGTEDTKRAQQLADGYLSYLE